MNHDMRIIRPDELIKVKTVVTIAVDVAYDKSDVNLRKTVIMSCARTCWDDHAKRRRPMENETGLSLSHMIKVLLLNDWALPADMSRKISGDRLNHINTHQGTRCPGDLLTSMSSAG